MSRNRARSGARFAFALWTCIASVLAGGVHAAEPTSNASSTQSASEAHSVDRTSASNAVEAFYGFDGGSPTVAAWRPFLAALSSNPLMRSILDAEAARSSPSTRVEQVRADANGAVVQIVVDGLRRIDDADLVAARPLIAKVIAGGMSRCRQAGPDGVPRRPRIQLEDELAGLMPVLTRAVEAVNTKRPVVRVDEVELADANRRAFDDDPATGSSALVRAVEASPECDRAASAIRLRLQGPAADAVVVRALLLAYAKSMTGPHAYVAGDPPAYPVEALRMSIAGSQIVRFTVDPASRLKTTEFRTSRFVPASDHAAGRHGRPGERAVRCGGPGLARRDDTVALPGPDDRRRVRRHRLRAAVRVGRPRVRRTALTRRSAARRPGLAARSNPVSP